jgi:4-amino-4-deoxy-L-arabinose transferase-like glycosyltransferase
MHRLTRYHALAFMVLTLLVAAALRLPDLATIPPGVHFDEAAYGLNAGDIGLRGARPIFIRDFTGREVLFPYLAGGMAVILGNTTFSLRLTAAFIGLLTIAATYWMGREMLADRRIALLAAALLATSFWHVLFSHLGFRAVSQPLLQALALAALFRGLRSERWMWLRLAGVLIGLTAYTYLASRAFPILLALGLLPLVLNRDTYVTRIRHLLLVIQFAFITFLPLLAYFLTNPEAFWVRIGQVSPGAASLTLTESLLKSLGMFFFSGDPYLRFNLPERPLFDFVTGGLLLVGWLICLLRFRRFGYDWQRAAVLLLLLAPLVMLLPTALAVNEIVPSNLRAIGLIPFIFFLPPIGLITLLRDVERRIPRFNLTYAVQVILLFVLLVGGLHVHDLYYREWATQTELLYISDGDLTAAAVYIDEILAALPEENYPTVYVAAPHYRHPTLAFLSENYDRLKWLPGGRSLVFPPDGEALYIYPYNTPAPDWTLPYLETGEPPEEVTNDRGDVLFTVYRLHQVPTSPNPNGDSGNFANLIRLNQIESETAAAGEMLPVMLTWTVLNTLPEDGQATAVFVHLEDQTGYRWSQVDQDAYPAEQWTPGEIILERIDLPLPPGIPPGEDGLYRTRTGRFTPETGDRWPLIDEAGQFAGNTVVSEDISISAGPPPNPLPIAPVTINETVTTGLTLLGADQPERAATTGEPFGLTFWWLAEQQLPSLSLHLSLVDEAGQSFRLIQGQPVYDTYPFDQWPPPSFVIDRQQFRVPDDLPGGEYVYRLEVLDGQDQTIYGTDLGSVTVTQTERVFNLPPFDFPVGASFDGEIALPGYSLSTSFGLHSLELIWQAETQPADDYTVFIHVLNTDGTCCVWQSDAMPRGGSYPTSRWLPGEVVVDEYAIVLPEGLPPGEYPLEVGLYLAETGQRLAVITGQAGQDAVRLRPLVQP